MRRIKTRYILAIAFLLALLILKPSFFVRTKIFLFETLSLPFKIVNAIKTSLKSKSSYIKENAYLREKSALLALELSRMANITKENERLKTLLKFRKLSSYKTISAEVIGRIPSTWIKEILINKGEKHGIRKRMAVCTPKGLIGSVIVTGPFTSKVMLITDPNSRIGILLEDSRQTGVLVGTNEGVCKAIYLEVDSDIKDKEKVITSGFGGLLPKGIIIGEVKKIERESRGFYEYAIVKLSQDLNSLEEVLCIE